MKLKREFNKLKRKIRSSNMWNKLESAARKGAEVTMSPFQDDHWIAHSLRYHSMKGWTIKMENWEYKNLTTTEAKEFSKREKELLKEFEELARSGELRSSTRLDTQKKGKWRIRVNAYKR